MAFVKLILENWFASLVLGYLIFWGIINIIRAVRGSYSEENEGDEE